MTPEHPITPPEDVIEALRSEAPRCDVDAGVNKGRETQLIIAAYRAGADCELEEILLYPGEEPEDRRYFDNVPAANIRAWRRPKPPSLAEQATAELDIAVIRGDCITTSDAIPSLRAALKRLQELEEGND